MENIIGKVVRGTQKSRTLGFPTANIETTSNLESGIYAGQVIIDNKKYDCALYSPGNNIIEAFIFEFFGDLYGKKIEIKIIKKTREKEIFKNADEAKEQITKDVLTIKKLLQNV